MPGKRIQIDDETWPALQALASDRMATFQELADEAFADLLTKHGRAADLPTQLKRSIKTAGAGGRKRRTSSSPGRA